MDLKNLKPIMSRDRAKDVISEIKLKICGVDIEELCSDEELKESARQPQEEHAQRVLENAIMLGLVYFDEEKECLVQKLLNPLKSGELSADTLYYSNELTLAKTKGNKASDMTEALIIMISLITGKSKSLIGQLKKQDVSIAQVCVNFFDM